MKKVLICCFICFICLFFVNGCSFKDDNKLVLVTEAGFAPYEFYQDGEIVGVDIEIAREIAKELGISRSYVSRIEKRALTKLLREFMKEKKI